MGTDYQSFVEDRIKALRNKKEILLREQQDWLQKENLAKTNVDRIGGAVSLLNEQIEEDSKLLVRDSNILSGLPLHDDRT